ncbi:MAG: phage minor head protein [Bacteroidales bacterium]|nr:phage minor head protein [Bacteroidales bacterium]
MKEIKIKYDVPELMLNSLRQNAYVFSGFKAYHELKEASTLLITEDGKIKSFNAFKQDVLQIHEAYNVNYLQAEYNFAVQSAQMAAKWNDFEKDGDDYNLQYRTAGDEKVRADHAVLNGTTLPASDPFWIEYVPPLDWNCRCTIVQVLKDKFELSNSQDAIDNGIKATTRENAEGVNKAAMFRFNPGKTMTLFPDKHPYFPRGCADCDLKVKLAANIPESELCKVCREIIKLAEKDVYKRVLFKEYENGGKIYVSGNVKTEKRDFTQIVQDAEHFAKQGKVVEILPEVNINSNDYKTVYGDLIGTKFYPKCPDFKVGNVFFEHEGFTSDKADNAFFNMMRRGSKQARNIVIDDCGMPDWWMRQKIYRRVNNEGHDYGEIYVNKNGVLRRIYSKKAE